MTGLKRRDKRGQALVEFTMVLPVILLLLMGMLELGFAISNSTTIQTATRQGARVGSELVCGGGTGCPNAAMVDPQIIGAVEGALVSQGSPIDVSQIQSIVIFGYTVDSNGVGTLTGQSNTWVPGTGPTLPGASGPLHFAYSAGNWNVATRSGSAPAQSIGVRITYKYKFITPLGALVSMFSSSQIIMSDQTVMAMEPPSP